MKSILRQSNNPPAPTSPKAKTNRYKVIIKNLLRKEKEKARRQTLISLHGEASKKNLAYYDKDIYALLKRRKGIKVIHNNKDRTPKPLTNYDIIDFEEVYDKFEIKQRTDSLWRKAIDLTVGPKFFVNNPENQIRGAPLSYVPDMDDITATTDSLDMLDIESTLKHLKEDRNPPNIIPNQFIKVVLRETDDIVLYESPSLTVLKGTEEAVAVEKANADYEFLTVGKGKNRRTSDAETQTKDILVKSRSANTERIKKVEQGSFVSNYDMFDTYADLERTTKEYTMDEKKIEITTYMRQGDENIDELLSQSENFQLSSMILQRLLAGNIYRERQKRFRNMSLPNPLDLNVKYLYRLDTLWTYKSVETMGKDVVNMSWCPDNSDLLAIGYGVYGYRSSKNRPMGYVCVWSIKNPVNPERRYCYPVPVTCVAFSSANPQLLAVGLYDGSVEVVDITDDNSAPVGKSERSSSPGFEPVWQMQWIKIKNKEHILTASQDGRIMKYTLASGPNLIGYRQLRLNRVEGIVEALSIEHNKTFIEADRHPQALCLQKHPVNPDVYFVGTDEGCVHVCSTNYPHQHTGVLQVHNGSVMSIEFSPFSSKIFLTCGSDWYIRIWIEDIFEPILELSDGFGALQCAFWSPIHSTIIASCTKNAVQFWDIRRKNLKPASVHTFGNASTKLTVIRFSQCGRSMIVGDAEGNSYVCALEDFPFPPHYQFKELQNALYRSLTNKQDLEKQVKQLGFGEEDTKTD